MLRNIFLLCAATALSACGPQPASQTQVSANPEKFTKPTEEIRHQEPPATPAENAQLGRKVEQAFLQARTGDAPVPVNAQVQVAASDGVVTLSGTVEAPSERERAVLVALGVEGVRSVVNNLVVQGS